ncbi:MAG: BMP family ABC transporter substrate-binding protein [Thermoleophilia bacterium]
MSARRSKALVGVVATMVAVGGVAAGCGSSSSKSSSSSGGSTAASSFTAGLVSDVGKFNDRSFNQSALEGLQKAEKDLGVTGTPIESTATGDYVANLNTLARKKEGITVGVGFLMADAMDAVALKYPNQKFAIVDYPNAGLKHKPKNVEGLTFNTNENSYLIGYLAAKMAKAKGGAQVISAVGGIKLPTVDIFIAGYKAGALAANPKIKVLVDYSQDFVAQAKCKEKALNQIAQGSQVVFQVAGGCGLGALSAAHDKGVWGVGVDRDQSDLGAHILTSAVKKVDVSVYDAIKDAKDGTFQGGADKVFNLANGGVGLGKVSPKVPKSFLTQLDGLKAKIIAGTIKVPTTL